MKGNYKNATEVLAPPENNKPNSVVNKGQVRVGLCPKKNYYIPKDENGENYVFLAGTVRPPTYERQFNMPGVT